MASQEKRFRLEIEGVRAIAAILVAVYHIWLNRVSGGVDVFFIMSGFLITTSLFSMYRRTDQIQIFQYIIKLLKRLIPTAWFIALSTFIVSFILVSPHTRPQFFNELLASLFYFENWRLAFDSVDYLAQNNEASPYQHYWALSIQFQFYLIWLLLFKIALLIKWFSKKLAFKRIVFTLLVVVVVTSFIYSVYLTNVNQPVAYYNTFTRVWEFGLGGILSMVIHRVSLPKVAAWILGWTGLIGLLIGGIIFQVSTVFPGYAALWPTMSAVLILLAGNTSTRFSAYNILASKPLVSFGKVSYAFYLWHWPVLIIFLSYFDRGTVSIKAGLAIIALSVALAYFTIYAIETPARKIQSTTKQTALAIVSMIALALGGLSIYYYNVIPNQKIATDYGENPGVLAHQTKEDPFYYDLETVVPDLNLGRLDMADVYEGGCFQSDGRVINAQCEYGEKEDYDYTIALVGGSHSAHWQPMLRKFGEDNKVRIQTMLKGNCRFSTEDTTDYPECEEWFDNVVESLLEDPPDLIVTIGDISGGDWEVVPDGFKEAWQIFEDANIPLFLIRDTPRYPGLVPKCVREAEGNGIEECKVPREDIILEPSALEKETDLPEGAHTIDVTDYFCDDDYCYPVIGNVVIFFDDNHITATLSRTFAPIFEEPLKKALKDSEVFKNKRENQ